MIIDTNEAWKLNSLDIFILNLFWVFWWSMHFFWLNIKIHKETHILVMKGAIFMWWHEVDEFFSF